MKNKMQFDHKGKTYEVADYRLSGSTDDRQCHRVEVMDLNFDDVDDAEVEEAGAAHVLRLFADGTLFGDA